MLERVAGVGIPARQVTFGRDTFTFRHSSAPAAFVEKFRNYDESTTNAFEAAKKNSKDSELRDAPVELFERPNESGRCDLSVIPATFPYAALSRQREKLLAPVQSTGARTSGAPHPRAAKPAPL